MFRYSLSTFLVFVTVLALVVAGLAYPNAIWKQIIGTATLLVLLAATIALLAWRRPGRWFWVGFAIAGWAYLALAFYGGGKSRAALLSDFAVGKMDRMLQTSELSTAPTGESVIQYGEQVRVTANNRSRRISLDEAEQAGLMKYAYTESSRPSRSVFHDIGHYAWALILGCLGGMFSLWLHQTSKSKAGAEGSSGQGDE